MAVVSSPLDAEAEAFYQKYGFIRLPDSGKMLLSMKTVAQLFPSLLEKTTYFPGAPNPEFLSSITKTQSFPLPPFSGLNS